MLSFIFQKSCNGQQLLERVFTHMDILERDYFGLKYLDANSVSQWLDPRKPIKKQSKDKGKNDLFTILPSIMLNNFIPANYIFLEKLISKNYLLNPCSKVKVITLRKNTSVN